VVAVDRHATIGWKTQATNEFLAIPFLSQPVAAPSLEFGLKERASELGFDLCGIALAVRPDGFDWLQRWLERGFAGEMHYFPRREAAYEHPSGVLPPVRSVVMLGMNYSVASTPSSERLLKPDHRTNEGVHSTGRVASYACGSRDYHDLLRERMKSLADWLHDQRPGCRTRVCVDTAPLLERDFAKLAGLGWFGKNTMLINKRIGSYFFLAAVLTDVELTPDEPHHTAHCGTCTRCLEACPTDAFVEPYVLDARKCISYLTIEQRDQPISMELRSLMGDWIFGCDVCQEVCPWNRKAPSSVEPAFAPREQLHPVNLEWLLSLDKEGFEATFVGTAMLRTGRAALLRNAAIALGNSHDPQAIPVLQRALLDDEPLVREAAEWAIEEVVSKSSKSTSHCVT
jgi:epoxyqueuosine reductase